MRSYTAEKIEEILSYLKNIEQCEGLGSSSRRYKLLRYLVEAELDGRGESIKAYAIALDVLGRGPDFDPATDSIVRVEMSRLRDALGLYFLKNDVPKAVTIEIPKGTYRPRFISRTKQLAKANIDDGHFLTTKRFKSVKLSLKILLFLVLLIFGSLLIFFHYFYEQQIDRPSVVLSGDLESESMAILGAALANYRNIYTIKESDKYYLSPKINYRIEAKKSFTKKFSVQLLHIPSGQILMAGSFHGDEINSKEPLLDNASIWLWIGRAAQLNGVIEKDYMSRGEFSRAFYCRYLTEVYFAKQTDENHLSARSCLLEMLAKGPETSSLYANLSLIYREEYSDQRNLLPGNPLGRAMNAARKAIELDPYNAHAHYSLMTILFMLGNNSEAISEGDQAIELTRYDGEIMGGFAARLNTAGYYDKALSMFELSFKLNPGLFRWRNHGVFLANFGKGNIQKAAEASIALEGSNNSLYLAAMAIGYNKLGRTIEAQKKYKRLTKIEPNVRNMYERRRYNSILIEGLVTELHKLALIDMCDPSKRCIQ